MDISIEQEVNIFINRINRQVSNIVSKFGISGAQAHIINFIHNESKNRDVFQRILKKFDIRRSLTNALQLMELKGLMTRTNVPNDAEAKKISLTEKGCVIQNKVSSIIMQSEQALRDKLTEKEYRTLIVIVEKLSEDSGYKAKENANNQ
ncbi:MAG: MarR family winged helix-turn-helix transcriptional regulator [Bacillus subtilis]|nr:MarR family winged helix-turn-helix transcriptional regulator [Bacillus subtilis]